MAESERDEASSDKNGSRSVDAEKPGSVEERRGALRMLVTAGGLAYAAAIAIPGARFLTAPAEAKGAWGARWIRVGRLSDLIEGEPRRLELRGDDRDAFTLSPDQALGSVWVLRRGEGVEVLSAICPHLGCSVDLAADRKSFGCPCHASRFRLDGSPESGPSPRPLDPLAARITDGFLEIDFRRYRQGLAERREVGS